MTYIDPEKLHDEIVISLEQGSLTKMAESMLILIAYNANTKLSYKRTEDREDCIGFALHDLFKYWQGFNPEKKNAFAYYTQIAKNGYAKGWNKLYPKKYAGTISLNGNGESENDNGGGIYSI